MDSSKSSSFVELSSPQASGNLKNTRTDSNSGNVSLHTNLLAASSSSSSERLHGYILLRDKELHPLLESIEFSQKKGWVHKELKDHRDVLQWHREREREEYAENLRESGVHGALIVLQPSFNVDILATALGIPPSKSYVQRHLATELDSLIKPARILLEEHLGKK